MTWYLVDAANAILDQCTAPTKDRATLRLLPEPGEYVVSAASYAIGFSREVTRALHDDYPICTSCHGIIRPAAGTLTRHYRCHGVAQRAKFRKVRPQARGA